MTPVPAWRRWLSSLIEPRIFDFWAAHLSPLLSWDRTLAQVVRRQPCGRDAVTLVLRLGGLNRPRFRPGQHLTVTVELEGVRHARSYSPRWLDRRHVALTVRRVPGGKVSGWALEQARPGQLVQLSDGFGSLPPLAAEQSWLLVAGGSGITPFRALADTLAEDRCGAVTLVYFARQPDDFCDLDFWHQLAGRHPAFRFVPVLTGTAEGWRGARGHLDRALLERWVPGWSEATLLACGPAPLAAAARGLAAASGQPCVVEAFSMPSTACEDGQPVPVTLARSGRVVQVPAGMALLPALEQQGVFPRHGCRMGICNHCACSKTAGTTRHLLDQTLHADPTPDLRLCIHAAQAPLTLDL